MEQASLVLFDGVCGLCHGFVRTLIKVDKHNTFLFAPLEGPTAQDVFRRHPTLDARADSLVLVTAFQQDHERVFSRSSAVLEIAALLGGGWRALCWLTVVPVSFRDAAYSWVARHRYQWFGQYSECPVPSESLRTRFLP